MHESSSDTSIKQLDLHTPLSDWLAYIESCHPAEIELGLDRMRQVAANLPLSFKKSFIVTVGGTNGKGSSVRMLETLLLEAGVSVGAYTSPHFIAYNERVSINGCAATDAQLCQAFHLIEQARGEIALTYFEFGTLAAFLLFSELQLEFIVLEVGLGGRLDSVNLLDADLALITTVALDHMEWLGSDRESIGFEKAGIFRQGKPAVFGEQDIPASVLEHAKKLGVRLAIQGRDFSFEKGQSDWSWTGLNSHFEVDEWLDLPLPRLPLQNVASVLQVLQWMPITLTRTQIQTALCKAELTGRMQKIQALGVECIVDVAHNPAAAAYLANALVAEKQVLHSRQPKDNVGQWHLLIGVMSDKDIAGICQALLPVIDCWHTLDLPPPRGATAKNIQSILLELAVDPANIFTYAQVAEAFVSLKQQLGHQDKLVVAGSFVTVSEVLKQVIHNE